MSNGDEPTEQHGYEWLNDRVGAALETVLALEVAATSEIAQICAEADAPVARAQEQLAPAEATHRHELSERDSQLDEAHEDASAARVEAASARAAQHAADEAAERERQTAAQLRRELDPKEKPWPPSTKSSSGNATTRGLNAKGSASTTPNSLRKPNVAPTNVCIR